MGVDGACPRLLDMLGTDPPGAETLGNGSSLLRCTRLTRAACHTTNGAHVSLGSGRELPADRRVRMWRDPLRADLTARIRRVLPLPPVPAPHRDGGIANGQVEPGSFRLV